MWDKSTINAILSGFSDEDQMYRDTELVDHRDLHHKAASLRRAHGAHVLDLAAGFPRAAQGNDRPLFAVNLPASVIKETSGRLQDTYLFLASVYIGFGARARINAGVAARPVVINAGVGYLAGPHDGQSDIDIYLNALDLCVRNGAPAEEAGIKSVFPVGNEHQSLCHASFSLANGPVEFDWMVLPNDHTDGYFEVWLPDVGGVEGLRLTVTSPDGQSHGIVDVANPVVEPEARAKWIDAAGRTFGRAATTWPKPGRAKLTLHLMPTVRLQPSDLA